MCASLFLQRRQQSGVAYECGEQLELVAFGAAHQLYEFRVVACAAAAVVEAAYLKHAPERTLDGRDAVDGHGCVEARLLRCLLRAVAGGVGTVEYHGVRAGIFFQVDSASCCPRPVHSEVEIYQWLAVGPESFMGAAGLYLRDGFYSRHLDAEFGGHLFKVALCKASAAQAFGRGQEAHGQRVAVDHHIVVANGVGLEHARLGRARRSAGLHQQACASGCCGGAQEESYASHAVIS